jgi:hypothetical protein
MSALPTPDEFTYRYRFASTLLPAAPNLPPRLALAGMELAATEEDPLFFDAKVTEPKLMADLLLCVSQVVRTRYFTPMTAQLKALILDPVVTSHEKIIRFEGFSQCCGVYTRADLTSDFFEADLSGRGTTNVDFNDSTLSALRSINTLTPMRLALSSDEVRLNIASQPVIERKVKLPSRWVKGFGEVQACLADVQPRFEISGAEMLTFVRSIPRGNEPASGAAIAPAGKGIRLATTSSPGAVKVGGLIRLKAIEPLLIRAKSVKIHVDPNTAVSSWEIHFTRARITLTLSPALPRGFSGEGQLLTHLSDQSRDSALPLVRAELAFNARVNPASFAAKSSRPLSQINSALAMLASQGLVGFDITEGSYFLRELPFGQENIDKTQPRLKSAHKLLESSAVRLVPSDDGKTLSHALIASDGFDHRVRLSPTDPTGAADKCTCPWYAKHQNQRGPCKHILAARMLIQKNTSPGI